MQQDAFPPTPLTVNLHLVGFAHGEVTSSGKKTSQFSYAQSHRTGGRGFKFQHKTSCNTSVENETLKRLRNRSTERVGRMAKSYDPLDSTIIFVDGPDSLNPLPPDDGEEVACAKMSCGHGLTPQSVTDWCRSLLDQGQYKFRCGALVEGTNRRCNKVWPYQEVRRLGLLTVEEMKYFEKNIALLAAARFCEFKRCPRCRTCVEREDLTNLNVICLICRADGKQNQFCWQCLKPWKGPAPRSDRCDNEGCINHDLRLLANCRDVALPQVRGVAKCPSIRACPTCGQRVEHDRTGCKNIICPRCQKEFCFVCLKLTPQCLQTSTHFVLCSAGVAPRQTAIPVWRRK